jgi:hypothetical protein
LPPRPPQRRKRALPTVASIIGQAVSVAVGEQAVSITLGPPRRRVLQRMVDKMPGWRGWSRWASLDQEVAGRLVVAVAGEAVHLVGLDAEGQVLHGLTGVTPPAPDQARWQQLGGCFVGEPAVVPSGDEHLDLFAVDRDGEVAHLRLDAADYRPRRERWHGLGGGICHPVVGTFLDGIGFLLLGRRPDGAIVWRAWNGDEHGNDRAWHTLGRHPEGRIVAWSEDGTRAEVAVLDPQRRLHYKCWDGNRWEPPGPIWAELGSLDHEISGPLPASEAAGVPAPEAVLTAGREQP